MKTNYSSLMQSRFFNPAFNSAIFDGPVRIYFAQFHESLALKIYFSLGQKYPAQMARAKELAKKIGNNILVMLYPSTEAFLMSFEENHENIISIDELNGDTVIGIRGPFEDDQIDSVLSAIVNAAQVWESLLYNESEHLNSEVSV